MLHRTSGIVCHSKREEIIYEEKLWPKKHIAVVTSLFLIELPIIFQPVLPNFLSVFLGDLMLLFLLQLVSMFI